MQSAARGSGAPHLSPNPASAARRGKAVAGVRRGQNSESGGIGKLLTEGAETAAMACS